MSQSNSSQNRKALEADNSGVVPFQFTGVKSKVENKAQYQQYLDELKPLREELGIELKEDLFPQEAH